MTTAPLPGEPFAFGIRFVDGRRAAVLDRERALQLAVHHRGQLIALYEHPLPAAPGDVATAHRSAQPQRSRP